jgi:hypothetical protein
MFARITHFKMKKASIDKSKALLETLKPQILALPGMKQFINTMNDDGSGCVISLVESRATSEANQKAVAALWANFSEHLEAPPKAEGFEVFANWKA